MIYQTSVKIVDKGNFTEVVVDIVEEQYNDDSGEDVAYKGDKGYVEPGELVCQDAHGDGQTELSDRGEGEKEDF